MSWGAYLHLAEVKWVKTRVQGVKLLLGLIYFRILVYYGTLIYYGTLCSSTLLALGDEVYFGTLVYYGTLVF